MDGECLFVSRLRDSAEIRTAFYDNQKAEEAAMVKTIDFPKVARPPFSLGESFQNSPRRTHLAKAGGDTLPMCMCLGG